MSFPTAAVLRSLYGPLQHLRASLAILPRDQDVDRVRDARPSGRATALQNPLEQSQDASRA